MAIFYDEAEMAAERRNSEELKDILRRIGASERSPGRWLFDSSTASSTKEIRAERDKARDNADGLQNDLLYVKRQRDAAERTLLDAGWSKPLGPDQDSAPWTPPTPPAPDLARALRRIALLESFVLKIGAVRKPKGYGWTIDLPIKFAGEFAENAVVAMIDARNTAEQILVSLGWRAQAEGAWLPPIPDPSPRGPVAGPAMSDPDRRGAFNPSRSPDRITTAQATARMIAFPVLDAIALLAVIDRHAAPYTEGTKACSALAELEQAVESWLDVRAGNGT